MSICPPGSNCPECFPKPSFATPTMTGYTNFAKLKETTMSVATVTATTVERTRAVAVKEKEFTVKLSEITAGYLYDLLSRHVSGEVAVAIFAPLARKLRDAGVDPYTQQAKNNAKQQTATEATSNAAWGFYGYETATAKLDFRNEAAKTAARNAGISIY